MEFIADLYHKNEEALASVDQGLINIEDCGFMMDIPVITPDINPQIVSTHPAMADTADNMRQRSYPKNISPGHSDRVSVCYNPSNEHAKQSHQQQYDRQMFPSHPPSLKKGMVGSKIPRPPNAFLIFANEWRSKLAVQYTLDNNKDISVRLGVMWKSMNKEEQDVYRNLSREATAKHKEMYPDYVYSPKEARIQKALRAKGLNKGKLNKKCHTTTTTLPHGSSSGQSTQHQQTADIHYQAFQPTNTNKQTCIPRSLLSSRMIAEQQRSLEETRNSIREHVEQGMVEECTETNVYFQL
jgi:hypothetical protein